MKNRIIDSNEFDGTKSEYNNSNSLHMMKLCYAVYAGTSDDIGSKENWEITRKILVAQELSMMMELIFTIND